MGRVKPPQPRPCHLHGHEGTTSTHVPSPPASGFASCKMPVKWENIRRQSRGLEVLLGVKARLNIWVSTTPRAHPPCGGLRVVRQRGALHCSSLALGRGIRQRYLLRTFLS